MATSGQHLVADARPPAPARADADAGDDLWQQGTELCRQGVGLWQHGAEAAHAQWQHGGEAWTQGLEHASGRWKSVAPYVDTSIHVANVGGALATVGFIVVGLLLMCTKISIGGFFDHMFWLTQGLYLIVWSAPALVAFVQCGILRTGLVGWPTAMRMDLCLGLLKFQLGRATFLLAAGFYVLPLLGYFGRVSELEIWMAGFSYLLGIVSILCGAVLLAFEIVLPLCGPRQNQYQTVPQS